MFNDQFILTNQNKEPVGPHGLNINHLDPANWMSHEQAKTLADTHGFEVAYVITEDSPIVCVDIDKCIDPVTRQYDERAMKWFGIFGDRAYCEMSRSGLGLHFWGMAEQGLGEVFYNRVKDEYEFYEKERYIILGQHIQGQATDVTPDLKANLKPRPVTTGVPETGAVPEYTGPTDDNELLSMAINSRGSAAATFGDAPRFVDLWNGTGLDKWYPSQTDGKEIDYSRADSALLSQLAFWTGRDTARMERLWLSSPMAQNRPPLSLKKLERQDYRTKSVTGAAMVPKDVYTKPRTVLPGTEGAQPASQPVLPGTEIAHSEYKTIYEQEEYFKDCVYVRSEKKILVPDGDMLDRNQFADEFGGYEFQMQADGARPTRNAWEAFTQNRCKSFPKAKTTAFTPGRPFGEIVNGTVNMYVPPVHNDTDVSPQPFLDLVAKLLPDARDQQIVLTWFASMVQNPGVKFQWAVVLQGAEGNGKTFLLNALSYAVGESNTHMPNPEDMNEKYNDYLHNNLLIGVEEVHMDGRRDMLDRLKKYITNSRVEIRAMGTNKFMATNLTNWLFLTNHKDAVVKTKNDRRYCVFYTAQQTVEDVVAAGMGGRYWPDMWNWARNGGFDAVAKWLKSVPLMEEFDPAGICHRAPVTSSTAEAIEETRGYIEQAIIELIDEDLAGFKGGWISSTKLREHLKERGVRGSNRAKAQAVAALGYVFLDNADRGRAGHVIEEGGTRPSLYVRPEMIGQGLGLNHYRLAQGYINSLESGDVIQLPTSKGTDNA